jgi:tetratricopeptide (TPR) repeat protein
MVKTLALAVSVYCAAPQAPPADPWVTLERWVAAIERHEAGQDDDAARAMGAVPAADFEGSFGHMVLLLDSAFATERPRALDTLFKSFAVRIPRSRSEQETLHALVQRVSKPRIDRFLKRAAMLHTDVALLYPDAHVTDRQGIGHITHDGRSEADRQRPWHWMLARGFLHGVLGANAGDSDVRLWYAAIGNHLWSTRNLVEGLPHVKAGAQLFPGDAEIQFVRGLIHEAQASPQIQAAVGEQRLVVTNTPRTVFWSNVKSAREERGEAEQAFRRALDADASHFEARLHLSHLVTIDGRYDEAARDLHVVLAAAEEPWHRYFSFLFLGRAEEGRGRTAEARAAYLEASALFPHAQAPRLAMSQIALRDGDRAAAMTLFDFLAAGRPDDDEPWWWYDAVRTPATEDAWMRRMWAAFAEAGR